MSKNFILKTVQKPCSSELVIFKSSTVYCKSISASSFCSVFVVYQVGSVCLMLWVFSFSTVSTLCTVISFSSVRTLENSIAWEKLDGVGPVDNWPSPAKHHNFVQKKKKKILWHVTHDMWHVTSDTWHMTHDTFGAGEHSLKISAP